MANTNARSENRSSDTSEKKGQWLKKAAAIGGLALGGVVFAHSLLKPSLHNRWHK